MCPINNILGQQFNLTHHFNKIFDFVLTAAWSWKGNLLNLMNVTLWLGGGGQERARVSREC